MKRALPFIILACFPLFVIAQQLPKIMTGGNIAPALEQPAPYPEVTAPTPGVPMAHPRTDEVNIGMTRFQIQTIGSLGRRVATTSDGKISAGWHFGNDQAGGWPDRGMAYNQYNGTEWGSLPSFSIEETRSGYPCLTNTSGGMEVVLSHKNTSATDWFLQVLTKMPDETEWTESEIPSSVPGGPVWGKIATGGADGNTLHVVAVSVDPMFGGSVYEGMDQHPLYWRSTDGGANWDVVDFIIPGLDSTFYNTVDGENYNIYANGETVAIAVFESWGDIAVFKSTDNGDNWTKTIVRDFPLDKYDDLGYTADDIPFDPNSPDSVSIFSTDGSGSVIVDDNGKVHVFFSMLYVFATGADRFLNLERDGICYWNEDYATGQIDTIATALDYDGDDVVTVNGTFEDLRYNNTNLTSFPTSSIDDEGNIYLVYTSLREDLISVDEMWTFRHAYMVKSVDGGQSWSEPADLLDPEIFELYGFIEGMYPSIPARIGDQIDLIYVQDYIPGLTPDAATTDNHFVMHVVYDKETLLPPSGAKDIEALLGEVALVPNPANQQTALQFQLKETTDASFRIYDLLGKLVVYKESQNLPLGFNSVTLDINQLTKGIYLVQMEIEGAQLTKKLVIGE